MNVFTSVTRKGLIENSLFTTAAKRAYLGCYYLSSSLVTDRLKSRTLANIPSLSMGFQKPNNLHYRNLMDDRGETLLQQETQGAFTSNDITSLVKLQHLTERIGEVHQMSKARAVGEVRDSSLITEMNIQMFINELQEWRTNTSAEIQNLRTFLLKLPQSLTLTDHSIRQPRRPFRTHNGL